MAPSSSQPSPPHWEQIGKSTEQILDLRREVALRQTRLAALVERVGRALAHPVFFVVLLAAHVAWVVLNLPLFPWFEPWDPYPFMFLATVTSAEAPFIALLVLMYQHRDRRVAELREELDLQVSLHTEREISMVLRLLSEIGQQLEVRSRQDPALVERMQEGLDPRRLMQLLRTHQRQEEGSGPTAP